MSLPSHNRCIKHQDLKGQKHHQVFFNLNLSPQVADLKKKKKKIHFYGFQIKGFGFKMAYFLIEVIV